MPTANAPERVPAKKTNTVAAAATTVTSTSAVEIVSAEPIDVTMSGMVIPG